ncbi:MAG: DUF1223 domain-containing protein [Pseudomonadota bacterium]
MKKLLHTILPLCAVLATTPVASAGDNVVMIELFTSQGCSSCPPADANLAQYVDRDDVLALSMHVDYWDYLGWRDTFARREHTKRQFAYRDYMGKRVVYTPQMIVHGARDVPGYHTDRIDAAINDAAAAAAGTAISLRQTGGALTATIDPDDQVPTRTTIWMASYTKEAEVDIRRGENAGETITYHNVVQKLMRLGPLGRDGSRDVAMPQPAANEGVAIWVQDDQTGRIIAASFTEN